MTALCWVPVARFDSWRSWPRLWHDAETGEWGHGTRTLADGDEVVLLRDGEPNAHRCTFHAHDGGMFRRAKGTTFRAAEGFRVGPLLRSMRPRESEAA